MDRDRDRTPASPARAAGPAEGSRTMASLIRPDFRSLGPIEYPESDGEPLAETSVHVRAMFGLFGALDWLYRDRPDGFVAAAIMLYHEEGVPSSCVSPDILVVPGIDRRERRVFKLWEEKVGPYLVIELTSKSTRVNDLGRKRYLYETMGVTEYLLFDPLEEYLVPRFQVYRRTEGSLVRVKREPEAEYPIPDLGLALVPQGTWLRVRDLATGRLVPHLEEATAAAEAATATAEAAMEKAEAAELAAEEAEHRLARERERVRQLDAELARLRSRSPGSPRDPDPDAGVNPE